MKIDLTTHQQNRMDDQPDGCILLIGFGIVAFVFSCIALVGFIK